MPVLLTFLSCRSPFSKREPRGVYDVTPISDLPPDKGTRAARATSEMRDEHPIALHNREARRQLILMEAIRAYPNG